MAAPDPITAQPRRMTIPLPRPLWIALAAVVLAVVAIGLRVGLPIYRQQVVIREIERLGGRVETRPRGPEWLCQWLGNERMKLFDDVIYVNLQDKNFDDSRLALMASLGRLEYLNLRRTAITGDGLIYLRQAIRIESLGLGQTVVGDADLVNLTEMKDLTLLDLSETLVTDAGLKYLSDLSALRQLSVSGKQITDIGLSHLKRNYNLKLLFITNTQATDKGVGDLERALPRLQVTRL